MRLRIASVALAAVTLVLATGPLVAKTINSPPGQPCARGNGNPCNGNQGNAGGNGNAGKGDTGIERGTPGYIPVPVAPVHGRGAYVTQIGEENRADIDQARAGAAFAVVRQDGTGNAIRLGQAGQADSAKVVQLGDRNGASVMQNGYGYNVLALVQTGIDNQASVRQHSSGALNGALLAQTGIGNRMELTQDGGDNRAVLAQTGDGNRMTVAQLGNSNSLVWTQTGNNLSDLGIVQSGGEALLITQTKPGG